MKIFCMSDIHGDICALNAALGLIEDQLSCDDVQLLFLGDYIHGLPYARDVLDRIIDLQEDYDEEKVVALLGNHEEWVLDGEFGIDNTRLSDFYDSTRVKNPDDEQYIFWFKNLPRYYVAGNTIFVHAGIDELAGELWEFGTDETIFTHAYPASVGKIRGLESHVVAGHVYTSEISGDPKFNDIFYDGKSHYYIDGDVLTTGKLNVLLVDTDKDKYYQVEEYGMFEVPKYEFSEH